MRKQVVKEDEKKEEEGQEEGEGITREGETVRKMRVRDGKGRAETSCTEGRNTHRGQGKGG